MDRVFGQPPTVLREAQKMKLNYNCPGCGTPLGYDGLCWKCIQRYHAPADMRDGLIHALLSTEDSSEASNLMCCLAFQGDEKAMETLLELERNPRPWRKSLYVEFCPDCQIVSMQHQQT